MTVHIAEVRSCESMPVILKLSPSTHNLFTSLDRLRQTLGRTQCTCCLVVQIGSVMPHSSMTRHETSSLNTRPALKYVSAPIFCAFSLVPPPNLHRSRHLFSCVSFDRLHRSCKTVASLEDHHIKYYLDRNHPVAICVRTTFFPLDTHALIRISDGRHSPISQLHGRRVRSSDGSAASWTRSLGRRNLSSGRDEHAVSIPFRITIPSRHQWRRKPGPQRYTNAILECTQAIELSEGRSNSVPFANGAACYHALRSCELCDF